LCNKTFLQEKAVEMIWILCPDSGPSFDRTFIPYTPMSPTNTADKIVRSTNSGCLRSVSHVSTRTRLAGRLKDAC
jgi:hypothetical protein